MCKLITVNDGYFKSMVNTILQYYAMYNLLVINDDIFYQEQLVDNFLTIKWSLYDKVTRSLGAYLIEQTITILCNVQLNYYEW